MSSHTMIFYEGCRSRLTTNILAALLLCGYIKSQSHQHRDVTAEATKWTGDEIARRGERQRSPVATRSLQLRAIVTMVVSYISAAAAVRSMSIILIIPFVVRTVAAVDCIRVHNGTVKLGIGYPQAAGRLSLGRGDAMYDLTWDDSGQGRLPVNVQVDIHSNDKEFSHLKDCSGEDGMLQSWGSMAPKSIGTTNNDTDEKVFEVQCRSKRTNTYIDIICWDLSHYLDISALNDHGDCLLLSEFPGSLNESGLHIHKMCYQKRSSNRLLIIGIFVLIFVVALVLISVLKEHVVKKLRNSMKSSKSDRRDPENNTDFSLGGPQLVGSPTRVQRATERYENEEIDCRLDGVVNLEILRCPITSLKVRVSDKIVGRGEYGVVREGIMTSSDYTDGWRTKRVAVKHMDLTRLGGLFLEQNTTAMVRELEIFKGIRLHSNVVRFYGGWTEENGQVVIVEELMHGNLSDLIHKSEQMARCTYGHLLKLFRDIASGVIHLHEARVIHHDLKPANVLVNGDFSQAKISDFGCARGKLKSIISAKLVGTMGYLPIECFFPFTRIQVRAEKIDVFSFGVIMWESVTGDTPPNPFDAEFTMHSVHDEESAQSLMSSTSGMTACERYPLGTGTPAVLSSLIYSCLSFESGDRPGMRNVLEELQKMKTMDWVGNSVRQ